MDFVFGVDGLLTCLVGCLVWYKFSHLRFFWFCFAYYCYVYRGCLLLVYLMLICRGLLFLEFGNFCCWVFTVALFNVFYYLFGWLDSMFVYWLMVDYALVDFGLWV